MGCSPLQEMRKQVAPQGPLEEGYGCRDIDRLMRAANAKGGGGLILASEDFRAQRAGP